MSPLCLLVSTNRFHLPRTKTQDLQWYKVLCDLTSSCLSDLTFYGFSPYSALPTLASILHLEHAQEPSCLMASAWNVL
jgi:hypothetical protein